jgi:hypothetical protein
MQAAHLSDIKQVMKDASMQGLRAHATAGSQLHWISEGSAPAAAVNKSSSSGRGAGKPAATARNLALLRAQGYSAPIQ